MESNIKHRILSQQQRNPYQKAHKQDRNIPRTLKKIPSLHAEPSSVTRAIQKLGRAAHIKYREAVQSKERRRDANQNESSEFANEKSNFMRKVSQNNLRNVEHLLQKNELTNYKSSLHVLANAEFGEKIKLQKLKKGKDIQRIYFTKGNNHQLLKELFVDKYGFNETPVRQNASICWLQSNSQKDNSKILSKSIYQDHLPDIKRRKTESKVIYNYLEGQSQLTNKQKLYKNMSRAYPQAISTYIPRSFIIDFRLDEAQIHQHLLQFMAYYFKKDKNKRPRNKSIFIKNYYADITVSNKQLNRLIEKSEQLDQDKHQKSIEEVETNDNLWILKPTYLNRGRGIHLFATLKQLSKLLSQTSFQISVKMYSDNAKPMTYIIQEYIDRPLLIDGYKFDMRFWVMLQVVKLEGRKTLKAYLFQQGYIRLASVKYEVAAEKQEQNQKQEAREDKQKEKKEKKAYINNKFIHLTNNAVQKDAKQYGQFCEGNQLSLQTMLHYFHQKNQDCPLNLQQLQQNVAKIVRESISCVKDKLIDLNHTKTFQLLGYDFLLDQNYMMWLIQANCNPCLQESSGLVGGLLRQMISGLIHLTHLVEGKGPNQSHGWVQLL